MVDSLRPPQADTPERTETALDRRRGRPYSTPMRIHAFGSVLLLSLFLCASHAQEIGLPFNDGSDYPAETESIDAPPYETYSYSAGRSLFDLFEDPFWLWYLATCVDQYLSESNVFLPERAYESPYTYFSMPEVQAIDLGDFVPWLSSGVFAVEWNTLYVTFDAWRSRAAYPPTEPAAEVPNAEEPPAPIATTAPPSQTTWEWAGSKRQGRSRAIIIPELGATTESAASFAKLDSNATAKWLLDSTGHWVEPGETISLDLTYSIPNIFTIGIGEVEGNGVFSSGVSIELSQEKLSMALERNGMYVQTYTYPGTTNLVDVVNAIVAPDVWGFALFGHGYAHLKSAHTSNGSFAWIADGTGLITVDGIQEKLHHRFGLEVIYSCYADLSPWPTLVSVEGSYHGGRGSVHPFFGALPLGYLSWNGLVEDALR